jgi:hypothetical protein
LSAGNGTTTSFIAGVLASHSLTISPGGSSLVIIAKKTSGSETGTSNSFDVINPTPTISSILPTNQCALGSAFVLTVNGSNFNSSSVVRFNGADRTTSLVNSGQVTANILSADIVTPGTYTISVNNPSPGGGNSTGSSLTVSSGIWLGTVSSDWHNAGNWCGGIPTATTNVTIPSGTAHDPVIGATAVCNDMTINTGASLTILGSNSLTVSGSWMNSGSFAPNTSTVIFNSTGGSSIGPGTFYNITISGIGTKTAGGTITALGNYNLTAGTFILSSNSSSYDLIVNGNFNQTGGVFDFSSRS